MIAVKVRIQKNDIWGVWLGVNLEGIQEQVLRLSRLFVAETIKKVPLEVAERFEHFETIASVLELAARHGIGGFYLGRLPAEHGS